MGRIPKIDLYVYSGLLSLAAALVGGFLLPYHLDGPQQ